MKCGYWIVIGFAGRDCRRNRLWLCRCVCGKEKVVGGQHLRRGASKSCGCKSYEFTKDKITGENHYLWMGGSRNAGSLAWCSARLSSLRDGVKRDGGSEIVSTAEDVQKLWDESKGVCAVCGAEPKHRHLHLDHDHSTGSVRAFLCSHCNVAIGMAGDSPDRLRCVTPVSEAEYERRMAEAREWQATRQPRCEESTRVYLPSREPRVHHVEITE